MQSPNDLQLELAELTGWQGPFIVSGAAQLLWGFAPDRDPVPVPVPAWPLDLGAAVDLAYEQIKHQTHLTLIIYHEDNENRRGPIVVLEDDRFDHPDFYGGPPDEMCDAPEYDQLAYAICVAVRDLLSEPPDEPDPMGPYGPNNYTWVGPCRPRPQRDVAAEDEESES
jgi:hypothetical protein